MKRTEAGKHMESGGMLQTGSWEYVGPDGKVYKVEYIADENGFRPTGEVQYFKKFDNSQKAEDDLNHY